MNKDPIVMRNSSSEIQAQISAENSPVARIAKYDDYPGLDTPFTPPPIIFDYTRGYVVGTGIPGATITPYIDSIPQQVLLVDTNGEWSFPVASTSSVQLCNFTQSIAGGISNFSTMIQIDGITAPAPI